LKAGSGAQANVTHAVQEEQMPRRESAGESLQSTDVLFPNSRDAMSQEIQIVDRGRGLQLSTTRITVQDLVPYFQDGCSYEEIIRWIPTLTHEEIAVVERYYREHQAELDEQDRRIRAYRDEQIRLQQLRFPDEGHEVRLARLREGLLKRQSDDCVVVDRS
jgi:uncharacterized protein (DUF433 family)